MKTRIYYLFSIIPILRITEKTKTNAVALNKYNEYMDKQFKKGKGFTIPTIEDFES